MIYVYEVFEEGKLIGLAVIWIQSQVFRVVRRYVRLRFTENWILWLGYEYINECLSSPQNLCAEDNFNLGKFSEEFQ